MSYEKKYYVFFDNGVYRLLTEKHNEKAWNKFYETLILINPQYDNVLYEPIFTISSLLEAIGEGQIKNSAKLKFPSLNFMDNEHIKYSLIIIFKEYQEFFINFFRKPNYYLKNKIKKQIKFSQCKATQGLLNKTLGYYKKCAKKNLNNLINNIAVELAWDALCSFEYKDHIGMKNSDSKDRAELIFMNLINLAILYRKKRMELSFFRISERFNFIQSQISDYRKFVKDKENIKGLQSIKITARLDPSHDLCDADLISLVTLGKYCEKRKQYFEVDAFTKDSKKIIVDRVIMQLVLIKKISFNNQQHGLPINPGTVYFLNERCGVIDKLYVSDLLNDTDISIEIKHKAFNNIP